MATADEIVRLVALHCSGEESKFRAFASGLADKEKANGRAIFGNRLKKALEASPPKALQRLKPIEVDKPHLLSYVWPSASLADMSLDAALAAEVERLFAEREAAEGGRSGGRPPSGYRNIRRAASPGRREDFGGGLPARGLRGDGPRRREAADVESLPV